MSLKTALHPHLSLTATSLALFSLSTCAPLEHPMRTTSPKRSLFPLQSHDHSPIAEVNTSMMVTAGQFGRHRILAMKPRYITVHTTQSYSRGATAFAHARMLKNGVLKSKNNSLGYLTWHFSVDSQSIYQSLPTSEQGQHADYEGMGNRYSIGIEMCENRGGSFTATRARTAKLVAELMKRHHIPISRVVGHNHWRRIRYSDGKDLGHKNCPKPLLNNGEYGPKWATFLREIETYR